MNLDDIILEIIEQHSVDKQFDIEEYCKKYPEYRNDIINKLSVANFLKHNLGEEDFSGKKLGEYVILQEIGRGGMGIVFLGIHLGLSRLTALKILPPAFVADKESLDNFQNEAKLIAKFNHPNIVPVYSINQEKGLYYIAMGYIDGPSLKQTIEVLPKDKQTHKLKAIDIKNITGIKNQKTSEQNITLKRKPEFWDKSYFQFVAAMGSEIAAALSYAHENSIIHGDLKPSNILLTNEAIPMVVDFGLARDIKKDVLITSKEFTGTLAYAAPERIKENIINEKVDIWSLGVILYESLTLKNPFSENTVKKTADKILKSCPLPLRHYNKKIPIELEAIVLKCLENKPENRYSSVTELSKDLNNYLESKPIKAKPDWIIKRIKKAIIRKPIIAGLIGLICILIPLFSIQIINNVIAAYYNNSINLANAGKYQEALSMKKLSLQRLNSWNLYPNPSKEILITDITGDIGYTLMRLKRYSEAIEYEKKYVTMCSKYAKDIPKMYVGVKLLGDCYYNLKDYETAIDYYQAAIRVMPKNNIGYENLHYRQIANVLYDMLKNKLNLKLDYKNKEATLKEVRAMGEKASQLVKELNFTNEQMVSIGFELKSLVEFYIANPDYPEQNPYRYIPQ